MHKVIVLLLILAITSYGYAAFVGSKNHYIDDCLHPGNNPVIFYDKEIREEAKFLVTKEDTIRVPELGFAYHPITCISVINLETDEDGGYVEIKSGGVGNKYVTFYMESQVGKGFDFQISVYYDDDAFDSTSAVL